MGAEPPAPRRVADLVRDSAGPAPRRAAGLVREVVGPDERVLVTGAAGWFGRTTLALLASAFGPGWLPGHVLLTGSHPRTIEVLDVGPVRVLAPTEGEIAAFAPTTVVNCAFPTQNWVAELGHEPYVRLAAAMTQRLLWLAGLPSVVRAVTFSSGAAVPSAKYPDDLASNPHGVFKAREEAALLALAAQIGKPLRVARIWSVSGPHVQHPRAYAFSDFVAQALAGRGVRVEADHPVHRRYACVADVVALTLAQCADGPGLTDSGGTLVELGELAERIAARTGVPVQRARWATDARADDYYCPIDEFAEVAGRHGLALLDLDAQIDDVVRGLRAGTPPTAHRPPHGQEAS